MDADRNLLFGVLALQADVIDAEQFIKICTLWTTHKQAALGDLLIELGWITAIDKADVERLIERKLKRHGGDPRAGLVAVSDDVKRSLAALQDDDINRSLCDLPKPHASTTLTPVDDIPRAAERYSADAFTRHWGYRTRVACP